MAAEDLVINMGPLVALARIKALDVVGRLPYVLLCPAEVRAELDVGAAKGHGAIDPPWLKVVRLAGPVDPLALPALDLGEAAVIRLALERGVRRVCIDEWKGRRAAAAVGLRVTGSLGLLARAKNAGLIPAVLPFVERALSEGIRYHQELVRQVLAALDESARSIRARLRPALRVEDVAQAAAKEVEAEYRQVDREAGERRVPSPGGR